MIRKTIIYIFIGFLLQISNTYAQDHKNAIGIRAGLPFGITYKHFFDTHSSLEAIIGTRWKGLSSSIKYEYHIETNLYPGLQWYVGSGAALGYYNNNSPWVIGTDHRLIFGAEAIIGINYNFENAPMNLSFDWTPLFNFIGYVDFDFLQFALSVRYLF